MKTFTRNHWLLLSLISILCLFILWRFCLVDKSTSVEPVKSVKKRDESVAESRSTANLHTPMVQKWVKDNTIPVEYRNSKYSDIDRARDGRPYYTHEIKGAKGNGSILVGQDRDHRLYFRYLEASEEIGKDIPTASSFRITHVQLNYSPGGFLFDAADSPPSRVGMIIPQILKRGPVGGEPAWGEDLPAEIQDWTATRPPAKIDYEKLSVKAVLNENSIILPWPKEGTLPESVQVVWFKLNKKGALEIENKNTELPRENS